MQEIFVQVLEKAIGAGVMELADISIDGTKIHADASKSKAVSHKRLEEIQKQLQMEVAVLVKMGKEADESKKILENVDIAAEISRRHEKLNNLTEAKRVIESRAEEKYAGEQRAYAEKMAQRQQYTQQTGRKPSGRVPTPPFSVLMTKNNTTLPTQNHG
jgi:N-acyl-D-aspartate/D-glutamate deacylase